VLLSVGSGQVHPRELPGPRTAVVADLGAAYAAPGHPEPAAGLLLEALHTAREPRLRTASLGWFESATTNWERYAHLREVKGLDAALEANR
jgi:hypothetical protein